MLPIESRVWYHAVCLTEEDHFPKKAHEGGRNVEVSRFFIVELLEISGHTICVVFANGYFHYLFQIYAPKIFFLFAFTEENVAKFGHDLNA